MSVLYKRRLPCPLTGLELEGKVARGLAPSTQEGEAVEASRSLGTAGVYSRLQFQNNNKRDGFVVKSVSGLPEEQS